MAPFLFQAARSARDLGVLEALRQVGTAGMTAAAVVAQTILPRTSVEVLLDALLAGGLVDEMPADCWRLTTVGVVWCSDPQVQIDAEFTQEVCWKGLADLSASLRQARPVGLRHFGPWNTLYEGMQDLVPSVRQRWLDYDHGHSDSAFPLALEVVRMTSPQRLLDVGANTGRFALLALPALPGVHVTLLDHPRQIAEADIQLRQAGLRERAELVGLDLLDHTGPFPGGQDAVWMSQFLDCFGPADVTALLRRAAAALAPGGSVWVLEVCPDRQREPVAAASLRLASLYFTAIANGVSRFYRGSTLIALADEAGLALDGVWDGMGTAHSLFRFRPQAQTSK